MVNSRARTRTHFLLSVTQVCKGEGPNSWNWEVAASCNYLFSRSITTTAGSSCFRQLMQQGQGTDSKGEKEIQSQFSKQERVMQRQGNGGLESSECPGAGWRLFSRTTPAPGDAADAPQGFGKRQGWASRESHCTFSCNDIGHETPVTGRKFPHSGESETKQ